MVEQATFEHTNTILVESISGSSSALSSSCSSLFATLVPLARIQKIEVQMDTLRTHIQPWMQRSIAEAEEQIERKMAQHTKW